MLFKILAPIVGGAVVFVIIILHNAWGDGRYVSHSQATEREIQRIDVQLTVSDQEIAFSDGPEKEKFKGIRKIYEREKQRLQRELPE